MTIAGFEISKCPHCSKLYMNRIIGSYNTFSAEYYSDGFVLGDSIPVMPSIVKCVNDNCKKFFNIKESEIIAEIATKCMADPEWKDAHYLSGYVIGENDLEEALLSEICNNTNNEYTVRIQLLRRYNDIFRKGRTIPLSDRKKSSFIYNLERLIELHKKDETNINGSIFLGELYREKGDFKGCLEILKGISTENENAKRAIEMIYSKAKIGDDKVFKY